MNNPQPKAKEHFPLTPNWQAMEARLKRERETQLPQVDTSAVIREFKLAWEVATAAGLERTGTGLVEQQKCFRRLRKPEAG